MIDTYLKELKETWSYTTEELKHIKKLMADYALCAIMDSSVRKEAEDICQSEENED